VVRRRCRVAGILDRSLGEKWEENKTLNGEAGIATGDAHFSQ